MGIERTVNCTSLEYKVRSRHNVFPGDASAWSVRLRPLVQPLLLTVLFLSCLSATALFRVVLEQREAGRSLPVDSLRYLPRGEFLKPALLGYSRLGADILWLQIVQVLGSDHVRPQDYEWMRHALDVVTTLDPQFVQAYDLGGVMLAELAGHPDWSNDLLEKGVAANPQAWRLPFVLGFNHFFHLHDYGRAADFMAQAARLPGSPPYVPELAARLYAQAKNPEVALRFLDRLREETQDVGILAALDRRRREVLVDRDLTMIERAIERHIQRDGLPPTSLAQLVEQGELDAIPVEPFGGAYELDARTGQVVSTTHPHRLRVFRPDGTQQVASRTLEP